MDAETAAKKAAKKAAEEETMRSFYPPVQIAVSTIDQQLADTVSALEADLRNRNLERIKERKNARIAEEAAINAAEAARIAEAEAARIAAVKARIAAEMQAKENKRNETWWEHRLSGISSQGGGRRGKKNSKRMIKMKNAKNKSKSKSQSRRQRQKRRRHSRRV